MENICWRINISLWRLAQNAPKLVFTCQGASGACQNFFTFTFHFSEGHYSDLTKRTNFHNYFSDSLVFTFLCDRLPFLYFYFSDSLVFTFLCDRLPSTNGNDSQILFSLGTIPHGWAGSISWNGRCPSSLKLFHWRPFWITLDVRSHTGWFF